MAGLVPAISLDLARPCLRQLDAGTEPAPDLIRGRHNQSQSACCALAARLDGALRNGPEKIRAQRFRKGRIRARPCVVEALLTRRLHAGVDEHCDESELRSIMAATGRGHSSRVHLDGGLRIVQGEPLWQRSVDSRRRTTPTLTCLSGGKP